MRRVAGFVAFVAITAVASGALAGEWEIVFQNAGGAIAFLEAPDANHVFSFGTKPDPADPSNSLPAGYKMTGGSFGEFALPATGDMFFPSSIQCPLADRCYMIAIDVNSSTMAMAYPFMLSTNGGDSWTKFSSPFFRSPAPSTVASYGSDLALFFGTDTLVNMTHDGGVTSKAWFVPKAGDVSFMSIVAGDILDQNVGYLANGKVTETTDSVTGKTTNTVESVGGIIRTSDLQQADPKDMTWEVLVSDQPWYPRKLQFVDENVGYLIAETADGYFLKKTTDGGHNWADIVFPQVGDLPAIKWVNDFWAFDADNLIVVTAAPNGDEDSWGVIFTISDGATPVAVLPDPTEHADAYYSIRCIDRTLCYAGGDNATIVKFTDDEPVVVEQEDDTGMSEGVARDVVQNTDEGAVFVDAVQGRDLAGYESSDSSGCTAGSTPNSGWFAMLLLVLGCSVVFGLRRSRS